eukprot:Colp12_sorted_trinity150504_noHs@31169
MSGCVLRRLGFYKSPIRSPLFFASKYITRQYPIRAMATVTDNRPKDFIINTNYGRIAAKRWGPLGGKRVLALHGWLDNAGTFVPLINLLPSNLHIVAIDLPGHGQSSHRTHGSYHFVDWIADVKHVVDALGWKNFSLLGHSMGASVSTLFSGTFPSMVEDLVILDGHTPFTRAGEGVPEALAESITANAILSQKKPKQYANFEEAVDRLMDSNKDLSREAARTLLQRGTVMTADGKYEFSHDLRLRGPSPIRLTDEMVRAFCNRITARILCVNCKLLGGYSTVRNEESCNYCTRGITIIRFSHWRLTV